MKKLSNPPLVESIFEMRWGHVEAGSTPNSYNLQFEEQEVDFFLGQFKSVLQNEGYPEFETLRSNHQIHPHVVTHRFRKAKNVWPCYQIGTGVMTVNQTTDGYEWSRYKSAITNGLDYLDKGSPIGAAGISSTLSLLQLKYINAFPLKSGVSAKEFINNKFKLTVSGIDEMFETDALMDQSLGLNVSFYVESTNPVGKLIVNISEGMSNNERVVVMETSIRSDRTEGSLPKYDCLLAWVDEAHILQEHVFQALIKESLLETFE